MPAKVIDAKFPAPSNALFPILVTLGGMIIDVKLDAYKNAPLPILVRVDVPAKVIDVKRVT